MRPKDPQSSKRVLESEIVERKTRWEKRYERTKAKVPKGKEELDSWMKTQKEKHFCLAMWTTLVPQL